MAEEIGGHKEYCAARDSKRTRTQGLHVLGMGRTVIPAGTDTASESIELHQLFGFPTGSREEYRLIFFWQAAGKVEASSQTSDFSKTTVVAAGRTLVMFPGFHYCFQPRDYSEYDLSWIRISGPAIEQLVKDGLLQPPHSPITVLNQHALMKLFDQLLGEVSLGNRNNPIIASQIAQDILAETCRSTGDQKTSSIPFERPRRDRIVAQALSLIWNASDNSLNVPRLVKQLPISRRSLERRFQQVLGRSMLTEITNCRVQRAKILLRETDLPIKQLASESGFASAAALTRAFQRREGITPGRYRKRGA